MSPYTIMGWIFALVLATIFLALILPRRKRAVSYGTDDGQADVNRPRSIRPVGKHPALAHPYGIIRKPHVVTLTPRQIERVNIARKLRGKPPLNRAGFKNAISAAWDTPRREPQTSTDWLTYLLLYEVYFADHQSARCSGVGGFTIDPNLPYNGQGGEYAGGGASGAWTDAPLAVQSEALIIAGNADNLSYVVTDRPDPAPSYSAPDPAPSYSSSVSDSSSSYSSSDSSSSSSYDSGSSSSSSDSGSSGGGGGD